MGFDREYTKILSEDGKLYMVSSLNKLPKEILNEKLNECDVKTVKELSKHLIDEFKETLEISKDDIFT